MDRYDGRFVARGLYQKLMDSVLYSEEDVEPVRTALANGGDPNYSKIDEYYWTTVLHTAVWRTSFLRQEKIDVLINEGYCDVNILDRTNRSTALTVACESRRNLPIVKQLLSLRADPNIISR
jgi:Ankyrin repeats (3 copies)